MLFYHSSTRIVKGAYYIDHYKIATRQTFLTFTDLCDKINQKNGKHIYVACCRNYDKKEE